MINISIQLERNGIYFCLTYCIFLDINLENIEEIIRVVMMDKSKPLNNEIDSIFRFNYQTQRWAVPVVW